MLVRYATTERFKVPENVIVRCLAVVEFAFFEVFLLVTPEVADDGVE